MDKQCIARCRMPSSLIPFTFASLPCFQASGGVNVVVKAGQVAVQLQDAFHVPLLELCLGAGGCFGLGGSIWQHVGD